MYRLKNKRYGRVLNLFNSLEIFQVYLFGVSSHAQEYFSYTTAASKKYGERKPGSAQGSQN